MQTPNYALAYQLDTLPLGPAQRLGYSFSPTNNVHGPHCDNVPVRASET